MSMLPDPRVTIGVAKTGLIHSPFWQLAQAHPDALALITQERRWTYAEVRSRAEAVATTVARTAYAGNNAGAGHTVAVIAERVPELVPALLGVLRAGAGFVILDTAYPPDLLSERLSGARPRTVLRTANLVRAHDGDLPSYELHPDSLAYLAFTSGSSGGAKAVAGAHRPVAHFIAWHVAAFGFTAQDRFAMLSGLSHDPLLRDIFTPLSVGASLAVPPPGLLRDPDGLAAWLRRMEVTVLHLTPSLAELLLSAERPDLPALRYAFFAGEVLHTGLVTRFRVVAPAAACVNFYGATETPQAMGWYRVPESPEGDTVPLGRGIEGVQLLVTSQSGRLAEPGETGEILVRSPYLALGYLDDPELTRQRFTSNPFTGNPGDRVYRTGDMGTYLPDGNVVFHGRADRQVKVRGFRVELGQVETALVLHPGVRQALVEPAPTGLVAYVLAPRDISRQELARFARSKLPDYAVPAVFIPLEAFPMTPNGKIDQRGLPKPAPDSVDCTAPRDGLDRQLAIVWEQTFGFRPIGIHANFFELGGDSIIAAKLFARIRKLTGRNLPLAALLQAPTVAELADVVRRGESKVSWLPLVPLRRQGAQPALFCVHAIGGNVLSFHFLMNALQDQACYGLQAQGLDGRTAPLASVEAMAALYLAQLRAVQPRGPYLLAGHSAGGVVAYEMARQLCAAGETPELVLLLDTSLTASRSASARLNNNLRLLRNAGNVRQWLGRKAVNLRMCAKVALAKCSKAQNWLNVEEAFLLARSRYRIQPYGGKLVLFRAADGLDSSAGWREVVPRLEIRDVPGSHETMMFPPHVEALAQEMRSYLLLHRRSASQP